MAAFFHIDAQGESIFKYSATMNCKRCGLDLGPHHANRRYHPECKTAADKDATHARNEAGRAQRALKGGPNCKRCGLDLGPHHANRRYHPECQKASEQECRSLKRHADVDKYNEQARTRYSANRASSPLLTVKCGYRGKGAHKFKTRDRRLHYCSDKHRELQQAILQRAADRAEYLANPQKHQAKRFADYERRMRRADLGKRVEEGEFMPARTIDPQSEARIRMAACLRIENPRITEYQMTDHLYPPGPYFAGLSKGKKSDDHDRRFDSTKKLLKFHDGRFALEIKRLEASLPAQRLAIRSVAGQLIPATPLPKPRKKRSPQLVA